MSILFSQTKCGENTSLEVTVMLVLVPLSNGSLRRTRAFFSELNMRQLTCVVSSPGSRSGKSDSRRQKGLYRGAYRDR